MRRAVSTAAAVLLACVVSWPMAAHAVTGSIEPSAPGSAGEHFAAARIATDDWCLSKGPIGAVDTDHDGDSAAGWRDGHGEARWGDPRVPGTAKSAVRSSGRALKATSEISDVRYRGICAAPGEGARGGTDEEPPAQSPSASPSPPSPSDLSIEVDAVALGRVESVAKWSPEDGASARIRVDDLQILGQEVRFDDDGTWSETFPTEHGEITATAEERVTGPDDSPGAAGTASAELVVRFDITEDTGRGPETNRFRLTFGEVGAHSEHEVEDDGARSNAPGSGTGGKDDRSGGPGRTADRDGTRSTGPSATGSPSADPSRPAEPTGSAAPSPGASPSRPASNGGSPRPSNPLPVTGGALAGLVGAALLSLTGGGVAMYLARPRRSALDPDD